MSEEKKETSEDRRNRPRLTRITVNILDRGFTLGVHKSVRIHSDQDSTVIAASSDEVISSILGHITREQSERAVDRAVAKREGLADGMAHEDKDDIPF